MFYSLDKLKPKTKTKNKNIFCWCKWKFDNFFIYFEYGGQENFFLEGEKVFLSSFFKVYNKVKMSTKNLVFSFSFWFQFIQRIEQKFAYFLFQVSTIWKPYYWLQCHNFNYKDSEKNWIITEFVSWRPKWSFRYMFWPEHGLRTLFPSLVLVVLIQALIG